MAAKEDACLPDRHPPSELVYVACVDCSLVLVVVVVVVFTLNPFFLH